MRLPNGVRLTPFRCASTELRGGRKNVFRHIYESYLSFCIVLWILRILRVAFVWWYSAFMFIFYSFHSALFQFITLRWNFVLFRFVFGVCVFFHNKYGLLRYCLFESVQIKIYQFLFLSVSFLFVLLFRFWHRMDLYESIIEYVKIILYVLIFYVYII